MENQKEIDFEKKLKPKEQKKIQVRLERENKYVGDFWKKLNSEQREVVEGLRYLVVVAQCKYSKENPDVKSILPVDYGLYKALEPFLLPDGL